MTIAASHPESSSSSSFMNEVVTYVSRVRQFRRDDWIVYIAWVGLMLGLVVATGGFLVIGSLKGVVFPGETFLVPVGAFIFSAAIAIDTIGHRTIYRLQIARAEGLVHHITIFCGVGSCVLLCMAYTHPAAFWIPAMVLTVLSFIYSLIDEAFHWQRYSAERSDRVEMWSHVFIFVGHLTMMIAWWRWFFVGYPGVHETLMRLVE